MSQPFTAIATLIAKPGQQDALGQHLRALVEPTRAEAGCGQRSASGLASPWPST
jgi:quinol monooxygenase YgiN